MTTRTWKNTFGTALVAAALSLSIIGCGAPQDDDAVDEAEPELAAQVTGPRADAAKTACALKFTECLASSWMKVLSPAGIAPLTACVRDAEACGLFADAPDAGTGVTPTCGFEIADCYLKNPRNPSKCQDLPCRAGTTK